MPAPVNRLKARLAAGETTLGLWLTLGSPAAAELAGWCGFDWCLIDAEHGPNGLESLQAQLQALAGTPTPAIIRVPAGEPWILKRVLDLGVQSVLVPMVDSAEEAARVAAACRYPPRGIRGIGSAVARAGRWGAIADHLATADAETLVLVQAESRAALAALDVILAVEGVDGVFLGPSDLAADMGLTGQSDAPAVRAALEAALPRIAGAGKVAGILTFAPEDWPAYAARGARMIAVGAESFELRARLQALATAARARL